MGRSALATVPDWSTLVVTDPPFLPPSTPPTSPLAPRAAQDQSGQPGTRQPLGYRGATILSWVNGACSVKGREGSVGGGGG